MECIDSYLNILKKEIEEKTNGEDGNGEHEAREAVFKDNIDSIFAKKKVKDKDAEEDSKNVSAILDVFGNGQVGSPETRVSTSSSCLKSLCFSLNQDIKQVS